MNILIDALPYEYEGYLINPGFQTGILIDQCLSDKSFIDNRQQLYTASRLLFGKGIPPIEEAINGLNWFLSAGVPSTKAPIVSHETREYKTLFSFDQDQYMIYSAFRLRYGINLNNANLHFFEFIALFNDLANTAFRNVIDLRNMGHTDIKQYSRRDQKKILALKRQFKVVSENKNEPEKQTTKFDKLIEEFNKNAK